MLDIKNLINTKDGIQSRRIFHDQDIYDLEMERIFARCWLFLTHESLIPNAGDYITTKMGQDNVIVVRQQNGKVRAFVNSCSHRGARVCAAEAGNTRSFVCSYHGWAYGIDGSLQGVPLEKEVYNNQLDKPTHGLVEVALVDSFCGFVYGCFDPAAPSLREFMGEAAWYLEAWMGAPGGTELIGPPSRSILNCNWKTPGENFIGDMYHVGWTHASSTQVLFSQSPLMALQGNASLPAPAEVMGMHYTSRSGHGAAITYGGRGGLYTTAHENEMLAQWLAQQTPKVAERLGAVRAKLYNSAWDGTIFPNNSFLVGPNTFKVWLPRGPGSIEALTWTWVEKDMPTELKRVIARNMNQTFGTAGMLESEDADNMESMTQSNDGLVTRRGTLNAQMGMGKEREDAEMPGVVSDAMINELSHRGFYRYYQEMLVAESWDELRANSSRWKTAHLER